ARGGPHLVPPAAAQTSSICRSEFSCSEISVAGVTLGSPSKSTYSPKVEFGCPELRSGERHGCGGRWIFSPCSPHPSPIRAGPRALATRQRLPDGGGGGMLPAAAEPRRIHRPATPRGGGGPPAAFRTRARRHLAAGMRVSSPL